MLAAKEISHIKDIKFVIIGDGDEKIKLQEFAKKNKIKNVKFIGPLERTEAIKILSTANIFMLNRKGDFFEVTSQINCLITWLLPNLYWFQDLESRPT